MAETRQFDPEMLTSVVPVCLRERNHWVAWKYIVRDGKATKCPINSSTGRKASSTDLATWSTFDQAIALCQRNKDLAGVGFVFSVDDPFAGVDLDNCVDAESGQIKPWALDILSRLDSYAEISPSGHGVKVFLRATNPGTRCKSAHHDGGVEIYSSGRFFTVTGRRLTDGPADVEDRQAALDDVYARIFGQLAAAVTLSVDPSNNGRVPLDDDEIIRLACAGRKSGAKFAALWAGRWNEHFNSPSEADSSVAFILAFYTKDPGQINRIFRRSGLMRDKWDERHGRQTYGEITIANALATVTEQYKAGKRRSNATKSLGAVKPLSGKPQPGTVDPTTCRLILSTGRTLPTAECFIRQFHQHLGGLTLRHYAGLLLTWRGNRYVDIEDDAMRNRLLPWLHAAVRMTFDPKANLWVAQDFPANPNTVKAALESIKAYAHLPATTSSPSWLDDRVDRPDPREIVPCRTSLLHLPAMTHIAPTPAFFNVNSLDYDHDPNAPEPTQWQMFLGQLFQDDLQAWDLLQEWFGYCLTGDTSQHKMLLVVGPRRSGKGTIARVLTRLVGPSNVCGPTTTSLAGPFGLQPLIGKSLAIVSDARFSGRDVQTVIERLLCISGEDTLTIDRKHMTSVTMKLPTRFVFLTNELPRLNDASVALAGRFMMLRLTESFYGREDTALTDKLLAALPGILNWAIEGWHRLRERGHFVQPSSVEDALRDMEDLSSPVGAFVRERCDVKSGLRIWIDDLYRAWKEWCEADGRVSVTTKQTFGRDLLAAVPGVVCRRHSQRGRFYEGIDLAEGGIP